MSESEDQTRSESRGRPEAVIFTGLQATGKSTCFAQRFFRTHVRVNLDMLRTRHREDRLVETCLACGISFVVDNTNLTAKRGRATERAARALLLDPAQGGTRRPPSCRGAAAAVRGGQARAPV